MGKNKIENLVFMLITCSLMVLGMITYNNILQYGLSSSLPKTILTLFLPILLVAVLVELFIVSKLKNILLPLVIKSEDPLLKKIIVTSFIMVCGMCFCMSLFATIMKHGVNTDTLSYFLPTLAKNFIVALPLQFIIVGPIVRKLFFKLFPI